MFWASVPEKRSWKRGKVMSWKARTSVKAPTELRESKSHLSSATLALELPVGRRCRLVDEVLMKRKDADESVRAVRHQQLELTCPMGSSTRTVMPRGSRTLLGPMPDCWRIAGGIQGDISSAPKLLSVVEPRAHSPGVLMDPVAMMTSRRAETV